MMNRMVRRRVLGWQRGTMVMLFTLLAAMTAFADGKMFGFEKVPPGLPYQRALLLHERGVETLILQSRYSISADTAVAPVGWVVPVPAVPELASMSKDDADHLFHWRLPRATGDNRIFVRLFVFLESLAVLLTVCVLFVVKLVASYCVPSQAAFHTEAASAKRKRYYAVILVAASLCVYGAPSLTQSGGVDVLSVNQVGIHDVTVIQSKDGAALVAWLNERRFAFTETDAVTFANYAARGWCFVVSTLRPGADAKQAASPRDGLAAPLILRFASEKAVYPLMLTGTGGYDTQVLLYTITEKRLACDGRLPLKFAGNAGRFMLDELRRTVIPGGFFDALEGSAMDRICRFSGTLTPDAMKTDLVFTPSGDQQDYRETVVVW